VVTDYTGILNIRMETGGKVSALALNAGIEMDMVGEGSNYFKEILNENIVSIEQIDNAVRLILNAKYVGFSILINIVM
jgi:beta-glucosidase